MAGGVRPRFFFIFQNHTIFNPCCFYRDRQILEARKNMSIDFETTPVQFYQRFHTGVVPSFRLSEGVHVAIFGLDFGPVPGG